MSFKFQLLFIATVIKILITSSLGTRKCRNYDVSFTIYSFFFLSWSVNNIKSYFLEVM